MRQVNQDELTWMMIYALQRLPASVQAMIADRRPDQRRRGQHFAAQRLAAALARLEILSDQPEPPPFRFADLDGGSGVPTVD
ncbi:hypothetical protein [Sphingomonas bacterium]|uniref:hypothetical protein n=1 Tax=Sphingomonas bacterium TaxID=1895847 RepID=UPI001576ADA5|nr:hypothetical protein [Sphingomonas bacterium]